MTDDNIVHELKTDKEFFLITPPRSIREYQFLQTALLEDRYTDPVCVWNKTILAGYEKYEICQNEKIPFEIEEIPVSNRQEAIIWICKKQLEREDLTAAVRRFLIGKRYIAEKRLAIDKRYKSASRPSCKDVQDYMGQEYVLTFAQLKLNWQYARALEKLSGIVPVIYKKIMEGGISLAVKQAIIYSKLSISDIRELSAQVLENPGALNQIIRGRPAVAAGRPKKERIQVTAADITAVTKQDGNAEVLSFASTVPAWTKAIGRVITGTDFACVSESAFAKLNNELLKLTAAINIVNRIVEEHKNAGN